MTYESSRKPSWSIRNSSWMVRDSSWMIRDDPGCFSPSRMTPDRSGSSRMTNGLSRTVPDDFRMITDHPGYRCLPGSSRKFLTVKNFRDGSPDRHGSPRTAPDCPGPSRIVQAESRIWPRIAPDASGVIRGLYGTVVLDCATT